MVKRPVPSEPHLLVDARPLNGARNGITRFVEQLIATWPATGAFQTTLISNKPILSNATLPAGIRCLQDTHASSRLPGTLWMTLRVPALARRLGATHFLGTQHALPLWRTGGLEQGVIVHDLVFELFPETMARTNRLLTGFFAPRSIHRADHHFCVSRTTRDDMVSELGITPARSTVCYPGRTPDLGGADVGRAVPPKPGSLSLLVVGSMEPRKNVPRFLQAFLIAAEQDPRLTLDLVSGDAWGDVLGDAVWRKIRQHPRIRIHQRISDEALRALYDGADYLIFPSLYEGFGLPILEAVGHCAVIANDIPVFRELAAAIDGVHLMDFQGPPAEIAAGLTRLLAVADRSVVADDHGRFSWQVCANRIVSAMGLDTNAKATDAQSSPTLPLHT
ncbi:glycosyltransferase family 1 protein [Mitsuaria sp. CC2]|uniref:glycosyltransferase family 4 protein n=1 Tax=Mitsuaria sp. CC2 TaxID=3029186 RepID=UPI003B8C4272